MRLAQGHHLAYCANIHRGETWAETLGALETYTLAVKERVCPSRPYAIGLRLSAQAARELAQGRALAQFQGWLERHDCYVFTINGFPFGRFHGQRVKEQVYVRHWKQVYVRHWNTTGALAAEGWVQVGNGRMIKVCASAAAA